MFRGGFSANTTERGTLTESTNRPCAHDCLPRFTHTRPRCSTACCDPDTDLHLPLRAVRGAVVGCSVSGRSRDAGRESPFLKTMLGSGRSRGVRRPARDDRGSKVPRSERVRPVFVRCSSGVRLDGLPFKSLQMHTGPVATVDPDNDDIRRYVVRRYAYDPTRHERRHQVIAAFDNKREFLRSIKSLTADLQRRRSAGESVDPREHFTGVTFEAGDRRRQQA